MFTEKYKPGSKPSEKREKARVLKSHLLPFFGEMAIESLKQSDVDPLPRKNSIWEDDLDREQSA